MLEIGDTIPAGIAQKFPEGLKKPALIVWLRHFGCRFYQEAKLLLPHMKEELNKNNAELVCVVQGTEEEASRFWPFTDIKVIADPEKETYKLANLGRTTLRKIFFPTQDLKQRRVSVTNMGCSMNRAGTKSAGSDILQLPGAILINQTGKILWIHRSKHTGDLDLGEATIQKVTGIIKK